MLYVKGVCLTCTPRDVEFTKNGSERSFVAHRCCLHDPASGLDPVYVETGEFPMVPGSIYRVPVRVRVYATKGGEPRFQLMSFKKYPPKEIQPPAAKQ